MFAFLLIFVVFEVVYADNYVKLEKLATAIQIDINRLADLGQDSAVHRLNFDDNVLFVLQEIINDGRKEYEMKKYYLDRISTNLNVTLTDNFQKNLKNIDDTLFSIGKVLNNLGKLISLSINKTFDTSTVTQSVNQLNSLLQNNNRILLQHNIIEQNKYNLFEKYLQKFSSSLNITGTGDIVENLKNIDRNLEYSNRVLNNIGHLYSKSVGLEFNGSNIVTSIDNLRFLIDNSNKIQMQNNVFQGSRNEIMNKLIDIISNVNVKISKFVDNTREVDYKQIDKINGIVEQLTVLNSRLLNVSGNVLHLQFDEDQRNHIYNLLDTISNNIFALSIKSNSVDLKNLELLANEISKIVLKLPEKDFYSRVLDLFNPLRVTFDMDGIFDPSFCYTDQFGKENCHIHTGKTRIKRSWNPADWISDAVSGTVKAFAKALEYLIEPLIAKLLAALEPAFKLIIKLFWKEFEFLLQEVFKILQDVIDNSTNLSGVMNILNKIFMYIINLLIQLILLILNAIPVYGYNYLFMVMVIYIKTTKFVFSLIVSFPIILWNLI